MVLSFRQTTTTRHNQMARKAPKLDTLRILYAISGNQCAFPDCTHSLFNDDGLYIAQLCHIEAANENGSRYNENKTDDDRRSVDNLMFLCHRHHKETDNVKKFSVEKLREIKRTHEAKFLEKNIIASNDMIRQIKTEISYFWERQKSKEFELVDLKIEKDFDKEILDLFDELESYVARIRNYCDCYAKSDETLFEDTIKVFKKYKIDTKLIEKIPYYHNPLINRNWEMHNIGRPNLFNHLSLAIKQLRIKILDELLKRNPSDERIKQMISNARNDFDLNYDNAYYVD